MRSVVSPDGLAIATYEFGAPEHPTVVAVHGFASGAILNWYLSGWVRYLLRADFHVILLDQRGHGASDKPRDPDFYVMRKLVSDVVAVLDAYRVDTAHYVGYSLGAQTAAILAGDEPRLKAIGIVAGRGSTTPLYWIGKAHAHLYFQAGTKDEVVPHAQLVALIRAAPDHPLVRWYATGHGMSRHAFDDQIAWQAREIGFRPHGGH
jgi:pimeloyl-ACP methyl ester carboxylesterase